MRAQKPRHKASFLSTLSLRRATTQACDTRQTIQFLSTLSLRRATAVTVLIHTIVQFLSTLSLRRATQNACKLNFMVHNFYPRSPCGERLSSTRPLFGAFGFLSTLSLRRATLHAVDKLRLLVISIHALLAESDQAGAPTRHHLQDFYPRSPCGERPAAGRFPLS